MRSFLEDADTKRPQTQGEKSWVAEVREMSYNVEDIIDEFMYHMNSEQQSGGKFTRCLRQIFCFPKNQWVRHRIATKLQTINRRIKAIRERNQRYGVHHIQGTSPLQDDRDQSWVRNHAESSLFVKDDDLVGIKDDKRLLEGWLMGEEPQRTIISVVGMGGLGKTTLVAQIYNSKIVKQHFDCYAWITVSQTYAVEDLLKSMIKEFYEAMKEVVTVDLSTMSYRQLLDNLVNYLRPKRYIVVLDDVWSSNLWRDINISLPDERLGSRVILTTRKEDIASSSFRVHNLQPLGMTEAWDLFCMKAFSSSPNRSCPQGLENLARGLVEKCEGLPLAIVALGGLMSSKKMEWEWRNVYNSLNWELSNNPELEVVKSILMLSFNDLSFRLKCCFLYCCLFPEDYLIGRKRLIRLWMAEGFVEKVKGLTPEDKADMYLMELVSRSMLQVVKRNISGRPKRVKMHDLLRELALSTSETEEFCSTSDGKEACTSTSQEESSNGPPPPRRLSIIKTIDKENNSWKGMSQLRSLLVFVVGMISPSVNTLPSSGFRLLRVLDLEGLPIVKLPDQVVDLFNLRYLNLRRTRVLKELPKSIGRLRKLQTLDVADSEIKVLPTGITKLQNLRHLIAYSYNKRDYDAFDSGYVISVPPNICKLKNLQVLNDVEAKAGLMKQLGNMTQLISLGIKEAREVDEKDLCDSIQNMNLLRFCSVHAIDEEEYLRMDALLSTPPHLKGLALVGKLERVPHWFHSLQCLTTLCLRWSRLGEDPLPYIQALPNLGELTLANAYEGNQLRFCMGFQKLTELYLVNLPQLNEIIIEKGVMQGLQKLFLRKCMELKMLPHGIEYLRNLQELLLKTVSNELAERISGEGSVDRPKVRHIPLIKHYQY
uniref:Putative disease resistance protein RPM1-like n=1 Tax=Davidia involucrata TaxID=16924 RepID=A0A5B6Z9X8_DAVIN